MKNHTKFIVFIFTTMLVSITSHATTMSLIEDRGTHTYDGNTNLEWLDVNLTTGLSITNVTNNLLQAGQLYEGYRYASISEFKSFVSNFLGLSIQSGFNADLNTAGLVQLLGTTYQTSNGYNSISTWGFLSDMSTYTNYVDVCSTGFGGVTRCNLVPSGTYPSFGSGNITFEAYNDGTEFGYVNASFEGVNQSSYLGSFLVRDAVSAVPVPSALPLMASVLGIFGLARCRNKSKADYSHS